MMSFLPFEDVTDKSRSDRKRADSSPPRCARWLLRLLGISLRQLPNIAMRSAKLGARLWRIREIVRLRDARFLQSSVTF